MILVFAAISCLLTGTGLFSAPVCFGHFASVDALDQRDGLMVRVDVDARDVLDNVNLGQKRNDDDDSLINVVVGLSNILNNATVNVGK